MRVQSPGSRVVPRVNSARLERPRNSPLQRPKDPNPIPTQVPSHSNSRTAERGDAASSSFASQLSGISSGSAESGGFSQRKDPKVTHKGYTGVPDDDDDDDTNNNHHNNNLDVAHHHSVELADVDVDSDVDGSITRVVPNSDDSDDGAITLRSAARQGSNSRSTGSSGGEKNRDKHRDKSAYVPRPLSPVGGSVDILKPTPTKLNHNEPDTARQGNDYDYFLSAIRHSKHKAYFDISVDDIESLFELHQDVGNGGYSTVRRAVDKRTGEERAIKLVAVPTYLQHRTRMEAEAAVLGSVSHKSIVKFYGTVRTPKHFCFVMELLEGGELFDKIIEKKTGYPEPEACRLITTILEAVEHLHAHGVVHRDIKPENFLFDYRNNAEGALKLIDFGFATFQNPHSDMLGSSCGTPDYIAPELLLEHPHNMAVDMWSVGVVLYILLCGFPPFYADSDDKLFELIARGQYDFPSPQWDHITKEAKHLVQMLLQVDPKQRYTATDALGHPWVIRNNLKNASRMFDQRLKGPK